MGKNSEIFQLKSQKIKKKLDKKIKTNIKTDRKRAKDKKKFGLFELILY